MHTFLYGFAFVFFLLFSLSFHIGLPSFNCRHKKAAFHFMCWCFNINHFFKKKINLNSNRKIESTVKVQLIKLIHSTWQFFFLVFLLNRIQFTSLCKIQFFFSITNWLGSNWSNKSKIFTVDTIYFRAKKKNGRNDFQYQKWNFAAQN